MASDSPRWHFNNTVEFVFGLPSPLIRIVGRRYLPHWWERRNAMQQRLGTGREYACHTVEGTSLFASVIAAYPKASFACVA
jgi:hypothetical protein